VSPNLQLLSHAAETAASTQAFSQKPTCFTKGSEDNEGSSLGGTVSLFPLRRRSGFRAQEALLSSVKQIQLSS
jgi:hypothetical protein